MFKSLIYKTYDPNTDKYIYDLEDTDFGVIEGAGGSETADAATRGGVVIAREYSKRNLDVGKNLAIYVLWYCKRYDSTIVQVCKWQDKYCPEYIENWKDYVPGMDEWLKKLSLIS